MAFDIRKDKSLKEETGIFDDDFFMEDEGSESIDWNMDTKDVFLIVFKLFSLALGILVMMYFEKQNIEKLNAKRASIQKELNGMQSQKSNMETEIKSFSDLDNKSQEFMQQLEVIQVLAKKRLQAISVLDMIQTAIPEKVWLKKIAYKDREFSIEGTALTNTGIQNFINSLENTEAFSKVTIRKFSGDRTSKNGNTKRRTFTVLSILKG